jgi:anti-anti-sigma factor
VTRRFDVRAELMIDDVTRVRVQGEVDPATSEILFEVLISALSVDGIRHVLVDLAGVTLLDASGIGVLLAAQHRAHTAGKELSVLGAAGIPLQVLEVTGVHKRLHNESFDEDPDSWRARNWQGLPRGR